MQSRGAPPASSPLRYAYSGPVCYSCHALHFVAAVRSVSDQGCMQWAHCTCMWPDSWTLLCITLPEMRLAMHCSDFCLACVACGTYLSSLFLLQDRYCCATCPLLTMLLFDAVCEGHVTRADYWLCKALERSLCYCQSLWGQRPEAQHCQQGDLHQEGEQEPEASKGQ